MYIHMMEAIANFRKRIEKLTSLADEDWALLEPQLEYRTLGRGEYFAEIGKRSYDIAFLISGSMRHFYLADGEERTTYFYFAGDLVGSWLSCLTHSPSEITIEALTPVELLCFSYAALDNLYARSMHWNTFGRKLAEYIAAGLEKRMVSLLTQKPEERYRELLASNKKKILEQIPQQYIASYLGITPVSLSRIRQRLAQG